MSGFRPHNPIIDGLAIIGVITAAGLLCTGIWWLAVILAKHPAVWVSGLMALALWVAYRWLEPGP
jgi:hypothetical protein